MPRALGTKNRVASVLLGCTLLFGAFLPSLVVLQFQLNREEIIRTRCVQRALPEESNCCKGSCHLKKELKRVERSTEGEQQGPRIEVRVEPAIALANHFNDIVFLVAERSFAHEDRVSTDVGYPSITDPVPWG